METPPPITDEINARVRNVLSFLRAEWSVNLADPISPSMISERITTSIERQIDELAASNAKLADEIEINSRVISSLRSRLDEITGDTTSIDLMSRDLDAVHDACRRTLEMMGNPPAGVKRMNVIPHDGDRLSIDIPIKDIARQKILLIDLLSTMQKNLE